MRERSASNPKVIEIQIILIIILISLQFAPSVSVSDSGGQILSDGCTNIVVDDIRSQAYVAEEAANSIYIVDTISNQVKDSIWVGLAPYGMDISSNGSELYVALTGEQRIAVVDLDTLTLIKRIPIWATPYDLKAGLPGRLYVTTCGTWNYPRIIDTVNNTEICNITGIGLIGPNAIVEISQDGKTLYIGEKASSSMIIYKFSLGDKTATYLSLTSTPSIGDFQLSSDDQKLFVPFGTSNQVRILDSGNWSVLGTLTVGIFEDPTSVSLVCNDKYALVSYSSNIISDGVAIFNISTGTRITSYDFSEDISHIRSTDNGSRLYCVTVTDRLMTLSLAPVAVIESSPSFGRSSTIFEVTISSPFDPYGVTTPLSYRWDWENDGVWDTNWSLSADSQHHYSSEGNYTVGLAIRDDEDRTGHVTKVLHVDDSPPITTPTISGSLGNDGWYTSEVQLTLNAGDALTSINSTFWRIDLGNWILYNGTQHLIAQGNHTVEYFSCDIVNNSEQIRNVSFQIDTATPELRLTSTNLNFTSPTFSFPLSYSDDVSGIDRIRFSVDGGLEENLTGNQLINLTGIKDGRHSLNVIVMDGAGNSIERDISFRVDTNIFSASGPFGPWPILFMVFASVGAVTGAIVRNRKKIDGWFKNRPNKSPPPRIEAFSSPPRTISTVPQYQIPSSVSPGSVPPSSANYVTCKMCGTSNPAFMRYCGLCRADLYPSLPVVRSPQTAESAISFRRCENCNNLIAVDYKICPNCGRDYSAPQSRAPQSDDTYRRKSLTALPIIGLLISLISAFLGIVAVFYVYSLLPPGYYYVGWFSTLLFGALLSGIVSIPTSFYAIARSNFGAAIAGSILSIIASWALFGIFTMTIALLGLVLIAISKDQFESPMKPNLQGPKMGEYW